MQKRGREREGGREEREQGNERVEGEMIGREER